MITIELVAIGLLGALWLLVVIKSVAALVRAKSVVIPSPQSLSVRQIERDDEAMADIMTYEITVGAPVTNDVVSRELTVVVDGVYRDPVVFPAYEVNLGRVSVPQDSSVVVSVVDIDDSGNRSEPATLSFQALDVVPPAAPGGLNVTVVSETFVTPESPAVVEPEVTPDNNENN